MRIASVGRALPDNYCDQATLIRTFRKHWAARLFNPNRFESLHRNVLVDGRHFALPIEAYEKIGSFTESNTAFIRIATDLGARAIQDGLQMAGLEPRDMDHLFFVSSTGIATPSIDALLVNRLNLRSDLKRTPIFGLGCVAGAAGVARAADYLRAYPDHIAVVLSVELCSLTLQRDDLSIANLIASGLFGDGAAAAVLTGGNRGASGPRVVTSRAFFYPHTEHVMGWNITSDGFRVVLSADVPQVVRENIRQNVDQFLSEQGIGAEQISSIICHPGGPKVLEAFQEALELTPDALSLAWDSLRKLGNLSSASVLMVLRETMERARSPEGIYSLMLAMGPGFCSELVLLQW